MRPFIPSSGSSSRQPDHTAPDTLTRQSQQDFNSALALRQSSTQPLAQTAFAQHSYAANRSTAADQSDNFYPFHNQGMNAPSFNAGDLWAQPSDPMLDPGSIESGTNSALLPHNQTYGSREQVSVDDIEGFNADADLTLFFNMSSNPHPQSHTQFPQTPTLDLPPDRNTGHLQNPTVLASIRTELKDEKYTLYADAMQQIAEVVSSEHRLATPLTKEDVFQVFNVEYHAVKNRFTQFNLMAGHYPAQNNTGTLSAPSQITTMTGASGATSKRTASDAGLGAIPPKRTKPGNSAFKEGTEKKQVPYKLTASVSLEDATAHTIYFHRTKQVDIAAWLSGKAAEPPADRLRLLEAIANGKGITTQSHLRIALEMNDAHAFKDFSQYPDLATKAQAAIARLLSDTLTPSISLVTASKYTTYFNRTKPADIAAWLSGKAKELPESRLHLLEAVGNTKGKRTQHNLRTALNMKDAHAFKDFSQDPDLKIRAQAAIKKLG